MKKIGSFVLFIIAFCLFIESVSAQSQVSAKRDSRVGAALEQVNMEYTVMPDGGYSVLYKTDKNRTQKALISSETEKIFGKEYRLLFSYASINSKTITPDAGILMLQQNMENPGTWAIIKGDNGALLIVNKFYIPADADGKSLDEALQSIVILADKLEEKLSKTDDL